MEQAASLATLADNTPAAPETLTEAEVEFAAASAPPEIGAVPVPEIRPERSAARQIEAEPPAAPPQQVFRTPDDTAEPRPSEEPEQAQPAAPPKVEAPVLAVPAASANPSATATTRGRNQDAAPSNKPQLATREQILDALEQSRSDGSATELPSAASPEDFDPPPSSGRSNDDPVQSVSPAAEAAGPM